MRDLWTVFSLWNSKTHFYHVIRLANFFLQCYLEVNDWYTFTNKVDIGTNTTGCIYFCQLRNKNFTPTTNIYVGNKYSHLGSQKSEYWLCSNHNWSLFYWFIVKYYSNKDNKTEADRLGNQNSWAHNLNSSR